MSKVLQNSGTRLPQLMKMSCFHQKVGEGSKSLNAMSPDPFLSVAFGKGSAERDYSQILYPTRRSVEHWTRALTVLG